MNPQPLDLSQALFEAVREGALDKISDLLASPMMTKNEICKLQDNQNLFEVAVQNGHFLVVRALIKGMKKQFPEALTELLLDDPKRRQVPLPIELAASLQQREIYDALLSLPVGYPLPVLQEIEKRRKKRLQKEKVWGEVGALLRSACPSKALADSISPTLETIVGALVDVGAIGLIILSAIPALFAVIGLGFISNANYQKTKIEEARDDEALETELLLAQVKNLELRVKTLKDRSSELQQRKLAVMENYDDQARAVMKGLLQEEHVLNQEIRELVPALKEISKRKAALYERELQKPQDYSKATQNSDYLTKDDIKYSNRALLGEILCTGGGLVTIATPLFGLVAGLGLSALATGGISLAIGAVVLVAFAVSTYLIVKDKPLKMKELAERRKNQYDQTRTVLAQLRSYEYGLTLETADDLLMDCLSDEEYETFKTSQTVMEQNAEDKHYLLKTARGFRGVNHIQLPNSVLLAAAIQDGDRREFKRLVVDGASYPLTRDEPSLLHLGVQKGNLLLVSEMLGLTPSALLRAQKAKLPYPRKRELNETQAQYLAAKDRYHFKFENYNKLHQQSKQALLHPDHEGLLPLHYAAKRNDPSLFYLLLNQPVGYSAAQIKLAKEFREKVVWEEQKRSFVVAIVESVCSVGSVAEINKMLIFGSLLAAASISFGLAVGLPALVVFGLVAYGNYFKGKVERGIEEDKRQIIYDKAYATNISARIEQLMKKPLIPSEKVELQEMLNFITNYKPPKEIYEGNKTTASDFVTGKEKFYVACNTLGMFLCSFSGSLGMLSLIAALAFTGPLGWGLLLAGSIIALSVATGASIAYFVKRGNPELKEFGENRREVYEDHTSLAKTVNTLKQTEQGNIETLLKLKPAQTVQATPLPKAAAAPASLEPSTVASNSPETPKIS